MKFRDVPAALRPTSEAGGNTRIAAGASPDRNMIDNVIDRWRASTMSKGQGQFDDEAGDYGAFREESAPAYPAREEVPRYASAPPVQPVMQPPHAYAAVPAAAASQYAPAVPQYAPAAAAPPAPAYEPPVPPQRPSILRRPISAEPLGPNNPAPLPSRYR
jgi:hypothetical protein